MKTLNWIFEAKGTSSTGEYGTHYAEFPIGSRFTGYYSIWDSPEGKSVVSYGIHCHEFGEQEIFTGDQKDARRKAQEHFENIINNLLK